MGSTRKVELCLFTRAQTRPLAISQVVLSLDLPAARSRRAETVYACPTCDQRYLGLQYCPECKTFCVRLGPGGLYPHCDGPLTIAELLASRGDQ
jgi:hypothetical protein